MAKLQLIRHGQAMFLTDNYDRLSELGHTQAKAIGHCLAAEAAAPDRYFHGTLTRQRETLAGIIAAADATGAAAVTEVAAFDEFPFEPMMRAQIERLSAIDPNVAKTATAFASATEKSERLRLIQHLLEVCIEDWVDGDHSDEAAGIPSWRAFCQRVGSALDDVIASAPAGSHSAVVSSGGVVAVAVQRVMEAPPVMAARLCWRVCNASLTQFSFSASRVSLDHFNRVGHLPATQRTYR